MLYLSRDFTHQLTRGERFLGDRETLCVILFEDGLDMGQGGSFETADPIGERNSIMHGRKSAGPSRWIQLERTKKKQTGSAYSGATSVVVSLRATPQVISFVLQSTYLVACFIGRRARKHKLER